MSNLTRFDPFQPLSNYDPFQLSSSMRELFDNFWTKPWINAMGQGGIKLDIKEDDKAYTVHADVPGFRKEDLRIEVEGRMVTISAESCGGKEDKSDENYVCRERSCSQVFRTFSLEHTIDEAGVSARYDAGVLEITLPKKNGGESRRIMVK